MNKRSLRFSFLLTLASLLSAPAATLTVTTPDNGGGVAGQMTLAQALAKVQSGDTILFNIPGAGPHYILTPPEGYPPVTASNVTIDGYSQPGSSPNTNPILASNNAKIKIFLDSRGGGRTVLNFDGYGSSESAMLAFLGGTNTTTRGLGFLARIADHTDADPAIYCVAFGQKAVGGHVSGCWFGVDVDGRSVFGANAAITGFRYREEEASFLVDDLIVGVAPAVKKPEAEFNVMAGMKIPVAVEGSNLRVSGNFIGVLPSGTNEFNNATAGLPNQGAIQIGRSEGNVVIGTDGDAYNDESERNVFAGVISKTVDPVNGYGHLIEFYGGGARTNIVIAGNYIGVGVDGTTRFTNGVPVVSGLTGTARIGSDFDGMSDYFEGNLIFNNHPAGMFAGEKLARDFVENAGEGAFISLRGNTLVNNFTPPLNPLRDDGAFVAAYIGKVLLAPEQGVVPVLSETTTTSRLVGSIPIPNPEVIRLNIIDLYLADPEGIATGKAEALPGLETGFIQGQTHLGSLYEGSVIDRDPEPGKFSFNIDALNLPPGALLTVTASYSQSTLGKHNPVMLTTLFSNVVTAKDSPPVSAAPTLSIAAGNGGATLTFAGGTLQSAPAVNGPWADLPGAVSPFRATADQGARFYRVRGL